MQKAVCNVSVTYKPNHAINPTPNTGSTAWPESALPYLLLLIPSPHFSLRKVFSPKWEGNGMLKYGLIRNVCMLGSMLFSSVCSWVGENGVSRQPSGPVFTTFDLFQGSSNVVVSCCNPAALCEHASVYTAFFQATGVWEVNSRVPIRSRAAVH